MKILNVQTNAESITIAGQPADVCGGCALDLGNLAIVVRGVSYSDNETNSVSLVIQPASVAFTLETQPAYEWAQGFNVGLVICPVLILVLFVRKHFARGDSFD